MFHYNIIETSLFIYLDNYFEWIKPHEMHHFVFVGVLWISLKEAIKST